MRFTCNKKAYPQFHKDCTNCSEYNPCAKDGKYCFVGAMENERVCQPTRPKVMECASMPVLIPHDYRNIKVADNITVTIDIEEMKRKLSKSLMPRLFNYGA